VGHCLDQIFQAFHPEIVGDKEDDQLIPDIVPPPDLLSKAAVPGMESLNIDAVVKRGDPLFRDPVPANHVLFHHVRNGNNLAKIIFPVRRVLDITLGPLLGPQHPSQEFDHPQKGVIIGPQAPPKPSPMDSSVGLKNVCP
jgi:hypothetical protein